MKRLLAFLTIALFSGCASEPANMRLPPPEGYSEPRAAAQPSRPSPLIPEPPKAFNLIDLQVKLGLTRAHDNLGYDFRDFDGCQFNVKGEDGSCGKRFLSVVNFRLVCRDSVETVQNVSVNFRPLARGSMQWRLAGVQGQTHTDSEGFGQALVVSSKPTNGQRFILVIGKKSLGLEVGEVSQIVLPGNWCGEIAANDPISLPALADLGL